MPKSADIKLWRILDANLNRAKEGLRVCEDICRFYHDLAKAALEYKKIRHGITSILDKPDWSVNLLRSRNTAGDVGRKSTATEFRRGCIDDVFYANSQRVKESLRVLEEFAKLIDANSAQSLKRLRYRIYALEQETFLKR